MEIKKIEKILRTLVVNSDNDNMFSHLAKSVSFLTTDYRFISAMKETGVISKVSGSRRNSIWQIHPEKICKQLVLEIQKQMSIKDFGTDSNSNSCRFKNLSHEVKSEIIKAIEIDELSIDRFLERLNVAPFSSISNFEDHIFFVDGRIEFRWEGYDPNFPSMRCDIIENDVWLRYEPYWLVEILIKHNCL